jgi:hypothetical protein
MKRGLMIVGLLAVLMLGAAPAEARWSSLGGRLLPRGDDALRAWMGFPGIGASFHTLLTPSLQLGPTFRFNYGSSLGVHAPMVGIDAGSELKIKLYDREKLAFALTVEPMVRFNFHPGTTVGMGFGPRAQGTYAVTDEVNLMFSLGVPFEMMFYPTFVFLMPITTGLGVEFPVAKDINLYFDSEIGPLVIAAKGYSTVDFFYRGEMGLVYRF